MYSASAKNNMEFMNNIGAYRLQKKNENLFEEGEVKNWRKKTMRETKEESGESQWTTINIWMPSLILFTNECWVLIKQTQLDHDMTTREWATVKIRQIAWMRQNIWPSPDWRTNSMTAHRCLHVLKSHSEHTHTHANTQKADESLCHSLPLRVPSSTPRKCGGFPL